MARASWGLVLAGALLGVAGEHQPAMPDLAPAVELAPALPNDSQWVRVTFRSTITNPAGFIWSTLDIDGIARTKAADRLGPDLGYLPNVYHDRDSFNFDVWKSTGASCVSQRLWRGMGYPPYTPNNIVDPWCYSYRGITTPTGYNFAIYPFGAAMMYALPGDTLGGATWSTWPDDQYSQAEISRQPTLGVMVGTMVRADSGAAGMQGYICTTKAVSSTADSLLLYRLDHTVRVRLAGAAVTLWPAPAGGVVVGCSVQGSTVTASVTGAGAATIAAADAKYRRGAPGVFSDRNAVSNAPFLDNWRGGGLNGLRTLQVKVPPAKPGQSRDYVLGLRVHDMLNGVWKRSPTTYFVWRRWNTTQPLVVPDTVRSMTVRVHISGTLQVLADSMTLYYRVLPDTATTYATPLTRWVQLRVPAGAWDTVLTAPPMVRTWRYAVFASLKPTLAGSLLGAPRDTTLVGKVQLHWTAP